jgi:hypothetical protein
MGTHCAVGIPVWKTSAMVGSTTFTTLASIGPMMLPSITVARISHFFSPAVEFSAAIVDPLLVPADLAGAAPHCLRGRRRSSGWFSPSLSCRPVVLPDLHVQLTAPCHQPFAAVCLLGGWFPRIPGSGPGDGGSGKTGGCSWVVGLSRDISPYNRERGIRSNIP